MLFANTFKEHGQEVEIYV